MKIKQLFILLAVGGAFLCSACQSDSLPALPNEDSDNPIVFMNDVDVDVNVTRSDLINQFPEGSEVGMYMYCMAQDERGGSTPWANKKFNCLPDKDFDNKQLIYSGGIWSYDNLQYWYEANDYLYTFFAYYPYSANADGNNTGKGIRITANKEGNFVGDPALSYTAPFEGGTADGTFLDSHLLQDVLYGNSIDRLNNGTPVEIHFSHLLTGLEFEVDNYNEVSSVTISSLRLKGTFHRTVTTSLNTLIEASGEYSGYFSLISDGHSQTFAANNTQQKVNWDGGDEPAEMLLIGDIAQNSINPAGKSCYIVVAYKIGDGSTTEQTLEVPTGDMTFRPGIKNIISLRFLGSRLVLDFRTGDHWTLGGDDDIIFQ